MAWFLRRIVICLALAALTVISPVGLSAGDVTVVAPGRPAVITISSSPAAAGSVSAPPAIELTVLAFTPPATGSVEGLVALQESGLSGWREIGRFAIFPHQEFRAPNVDEAQRFLFPAFPVGQASRRVAAGAKLKVELVPRNGDGQGARLELGAITIVED